MTNVMNFPQNRSYLTESFENNSPETSESENEQESDERNIILIEVEFSTDHWVLFSSICQNSFDDVKIISKYDDDDEDDQPKTHALIETSPKSLETLQNYCANATIDCTFQNPKVW